MQLLAKSKIEGVGKHKRGRMLRVLQPLVEGILAPLQLGGEPGIWDRLERLGELWLQYGRAINLTGARDERGLADHVAEGLMAVKCARSAVGAGGIWVDVGSGAGFPGLVAAAAGWKTVLVEPRVRRASFLRLAAASAGLNAEVFQARRELGTWRQTGTESLERLEEMRFTVASARAVLAPESWLEMGRELVDRDGVVIVHGTIGDGMSEDAVVELTAGAWRVAAYSARRRVLGVSSEAGDGSE